MSPQAFDAAANAAARKIAAKVPCGFYVCRLSQATETAKERAGSRTAAEPTASHLYHANE